MHLLADDNTYLPAHSSVLEPCSEVLAEAVQEKRDFYQKLQQHHPAEAMVLRMPDTWPRQILHLLKVAYAPEAAQRAEVLAAMDLQDLHGLAEVALASQCQDIADLVDHALVDRCDGIDKYSAVSTFFWARELGLPKLVSFCGEYIKHHRDYVHIGPNHRAMADLLWWTTGASHINGRGEHWSYQRARPIKS